jgi:hypothetical protein
MFTINVYDDIVPKYFGDGTYVELQKVLLIMIAWMQDTLNENNYVLSDDTFWNNSPDTIPMPRMLYMTDEQDRIAFKLKFGV